MGYMGRIHLTTARVALLTTALEMYTEQLAAIEERETWLQSSARALLEELVELPAGPGLIISVPATADEVLQLGLFARGGAVK